ncbi:FHA domain-containing protein [Microbacterium sp. zg.B48]|uniref:FHA domain-containing protein n=1 Tax=Microbacterium sp. zg.B48 TaxID=2969408 RepID=UPI00214CB03F|nr:FHA domain-containing protein [Microbacterium sp. zg.B48]MCR2763859.1 FHA domain-containing protein [Microbacterium sp. zg.B48]
MQTIYRPGQWYLIVLPGTLVALPPDVSGDVVARLWERMQERGTLTTVVEVLTAQAGGVFTSLPPFVAVVAEGADIRIALRGEVSARVSTASGADEFSGADVTTWSERFVVGASRVEITVEAVEGAAALPVQSGVVRAAAVSAELESGQEWTPIATPPATPLVAPMAEPIAAPIAVTEPVETPLGTPIAEAQPVDDPSTHSAAEPGEPEQPAAEAEAVPVVDGATMTPTEHTLAPPTEDFDQLWGATVHSVPAVTPASGATADVVGLDGDHDGATISVPELRALRQQRPPTDDVPTAVMPVVPGATGRVRVSTGQVVTLDRTVIIGRRPRSTRASGANLPHLIAVDSPQQDISRSHLEIRPEGDTVVVIDLHTTNGSTLLRPGTDPMRLHPGEQTLVLSGDVVDLGDGVKVAFEDLP